MHAVMRGVGVLVAWSMCAWARAGEPPAGGAPASGPEAADVSAALAPIRERHGLPGLAVVVLHGESIVARGAAGVRKAGSPEPITAHDVFHLGSCTKSMTATMCAMLV